MFNLKNTLFAAVLFIIAINLIVVGDKYFALQVSLPMVFAFALMTALILVLPVAALVQGTEILRRLRGLEPNTGSVAYSYAGDGVGAPSVRSFRDELAHSLAVTLAPHLCHQMKADELGVYIRSVVDEVHGAGGNSAALDAAKAAMAVYAQMTVSAYGAMQGGAIKSDEKVEEQGNHKCLLHSVGGCTLCARDSAAPSSN